MESGKRRSQRDYTLTFKLSFVDQVEKGELSYKEAHRETQPEGWEASTFHLAVQVRSGYEGMQIALPSDYLSHQSTSESLAERLLALARNIQPKQVAKSKRGSKVPKSKDWLEGKAANAHVSTDRVLKAAITQRP